MTSVARNAKHVNVKIHNLNFRPSLKVTFEIFIADRKGKLLPVVKAFLPCCVNLTALPCSGSILLDSSTEEGTIQQTTN